MSTFSPKTKVLPFKIVRRMHRFSGPGDLYLTISWISESSSCWTQGGGQRERVGERAGPGTWTRDQGIFKPSLVQPFSSIVKNRVRGTS